MYWATLRRHWRLAPCIVAAAVLAGHRRRRAVAAQSYDATAKVLIGQRTQLDALLGAAGLRARPRARGQHQPRAGLARAGRRETSGGRLWPSRRYRRALGKLSAQIDRNSNVVSITVRDASPERAARIANAFALAFRDFAARSAQASIEDAIAAAKRARRGLAPGPDRDALEARDAAARRPPAPSRPAASRSSAGHGGFGRRPPGSALKSAVVAGLLGVILAALRSSCSPAPTSAYAARTSSRRCSAPPVLATLPTPRSSNPGGTVAATRSRRSALSLGLRLRSSASQGGAPQRTAYSVFVPGYVAGRRVRARARWRSAWRARWARWDGG